VYPKPNGSLIKEEVDGDCFNDGGSFIFIDADSDNVAVCGSFICRPKESKGTCESPAPWKNINRFVSIPSCECLYVYEFGVSPSIVFVDDDSTFFVDNDGLGKLLLLFVFSRLIGPTSFQVPFSLCVSSLTVSEFFFITSAVESSPAAALLVMMGIQVDFLCIRQSAR